MNVFVYGTLMEETVVRRVLNKDVDAAQATATGYRRVCLKDRVYPGVLPCLDAKPLSGKV